MEVEMPEENKDGYYLINWVEPSGQRRCGLASYDSQLNIYKVNWVDPQGNSGTTVLDKNTPVSKINLLQLPLDEL